MNAMTDDDLIRQLEALGGDLDRAVVEARGGHDGALVERVRSAIESTPGRRASRSWAAAAVLVVIAALGVLAVPDSRHAVARWFGLDGVDIEIEPSLSLPSDDGFLEDLVPGERRVVERDGREILVMAVRGTFDDGLITKTVGSSDQLEQVTVNGSPGLWIAEAPHEVLYVDPDSDVVIERVAANTLIWNDGEVLYRVEGFDDVEDALAYANTVDEPSGHQD